MWAGQLNIVPASLAPHRRGSRGRETRAPHRPASGQRWLWLPKGLLQPWHSGPWPSRGSAPKQPCPPQPQRALQAAPVAPVSRSCPRALALVTVFLPFPGLCRWLNSPWNIKCNCHYCVFLCKMVVSKLSACDSCSGLVCPFPSALPGCEPSWVTGSSLGTADLTCHRNSIAKLQWSAVISRI